jgi:hypothetical protein
LSTRFFKKNSINRQIIKLPSMRTIIGQKPTT